MKLWICRNTMDLLRAFINKPYSFKAYDDQYGIDYDWSDGNPPVIIFESDLFPEVTFENSPQQVEIKLIKK